VNHISDHDLERFHLGLMLDEAELASIEDHLLWCHSCVDRAGESAQYVDDFRAAIIVGNFDLE
jgi:hypothetical protein